MIQNCWRKMIAKAGMTQNQLADAVSMNKGEMSRVCGGAAIPTWDMLHACCAALSCAPVDIYGENELVVLYQVGASAIDQKPKKEPARIRVQLCEKSYRLIDRAVEDGIYENRYEAVNEIIQERLG